MAPMPEAVFATLLLSDSYLPGKLVFVLASAYHSDTCSGAMVLGHSLKNGGAKAKLVVLVTLGNLSKSTIEELKIVYDEIVPISRIVNGTPANLYLMDRPDLVSTFTKIELWKQTQYHQIVYIDADAVALRAPNELLHLDASFAAVPDVGWPDCFNSGVLVLRPNMGDYYSLLALAQRGISFDGADQGLLNMHFRNWERLSFAYNCTPSGNYQYVPAYRHFQSSVNVVHFIGQDKPWMLGRNSKHTGVYDELLGRWWSVYDKYYRISKFSYTSDRQPGSFGTVQKYVVGESVPEVYGFSTSEPSSLPQRRVEDPSTGTLEPLADQPEPAEKIQQEMFEPVPTIEQTRFSAPQAEWDAARAPPPSDSMPEASNFPSTRYAMSGDTQLFKPPEKYPDPPKDMWYEVPPKSLAAQRPAPIFPWETRAPKPTRVFLDEKPATPKPETTQAQPSSPSIAISTDEATASSRASPVTPTVKVAESDPWQTYSRSNAWDDMPDIERYVQVLSQARKGKVQVLHRATPSGSSDGVLSPNAEETPRRPSMKLTDFPTEIERPSLPVTPAPIRRTSFWGEERSELSDLPGAEGVPKQADWNPLEKLEELQRRQSNVLEKGPAEPAPTNIPKRKMPESQSAPTPAAASSQALSQSSAPALREPDFDQEFDDQELEKEREVAPEIPITA